jgi:hypothetical protein
VNRRRFLQSITAFRHALRELGYVEGQKPLGASVSLTPWNRCAMLEVAEVTRGGTTPGVRGETAAN